MAHEKLRPNYIFDEVKIEQLKQIAPECFEDGQINFETLKQNLGEWSENEENPELEHFGLFWPGKRDARKIATTQPEGTLEPIWGEGLKKDGTIDMDGKNDSKNIFIEGENLEVLKLLQKSYAGKIKMIYIDPPYNTGNDFIYDDDFTEPLQEYLKRTGQVDEEGKVLTTNKRSDGRFHSKWLSMIYPRLRLARNLLHEDGVMFISIDENEIHNLKILVNEIFGDENFLTTIIWQKVFSPKNTAMYFSEDHEYILAVCKNKETWRPVLIPRSEESINRYTNLDNDSRGEWMSGAIQARNYYSKGQYEVTSPSGKKHSNPKGTYWRVSKEKFDELDSDNRIWWGDKGDNVPRLKRFLTEVKQGVVPQTLWTFKDVGHTQEAKEELLKYVDFENTENVLNSVKPTRLIDKLIQIGTSDEENDIVLDFFSGSGPTAQSVLKKNLNDNGTRKFILVQFPEPLPKPEIKVKTIADLGKSRIRKFSNEIVKQGFDKGFRVMKLVKSNFKLWKNYKGASVTDLEKKLTLFNENPLVEDYTKEGLLTEILLMEGLALCSDINIIDEIKTNSIIKIKSEYSQHSLLICLDETIKKSTIENLVLGDDDIFICLDSAISTEDKLRLSDKGLIKTI